jgi:hypothetical protein
MKRRSRFLLCATTLIFAFSAMHRDGNVLHAVYPDCYAGANAVLYSLPGYSELEQTNSGWSEWNDLDTGPMNQSQCNFFGNEDGTTELDRACSDAHAFYSWNGARGEYAAYVEWYYRWFDSGNTEHDGGSSYGPVDCVDILCQDGYSSYCGY